MCEGFFPIPISNSGDTNWVFHHSAQFWHCLPGSSIRSHRVRARSHKTGPTFTSDSQSQVCLVTCASNRNAVDYRFQQSLARILYIFLEWLTELRETFYLLDYWLLHKNSTQEQPDHRHSQDNVDPRKKDSLDVDPEKEFIPWCRLSLVKRGPTF